MTGKESAMPQGEGRFWKGHYGREPFDLRLTVLRMLHRLPLIALVTVLGTAAFGGGYYVKNVLLRDQRLFAATSVYRVDYNVASEAELQTSYINAMTWNTYLQSGAFQEMLQSRLGGSGGFPEQASGEGMEAFVWSDLRVPAVTVTAEDPAEAERILRAVDEVMTKDFTLQEIRSVSVIDAGRAEEIIPDVRVGRAAALSAVLSCFFAVIALLMKETGDDGIWLPSTVWKRYGLKAAGTLESPGLKQNMRYFFGEKHDGGDLAPERKGREDAARKGWEQENGKRGVAVCTVQEDMKPEAVLAGLRERCPETVDSSWFAAASPLTQPENCDVLREASGILLAVKAGCHGGRKLEYVLEYLQQQDCEVTAAILWEADEKLIRRYYFGRTGRGRAAEER